MSGDQASQNIEPSTAEPLEQKLPVNCTLKNIDKSSNVVITANGLKIHSNLNPYALEFYPSSLKTKPEDQVKEEVKVLNLKDEKDNKIYEKTEKLDENSTKINSEEVQQYVKEKEDLKCSLKNKPETQVKEAVKKLSLKACKANKSCAKAEKVDESPTKTTSTVSEDMQQNVKETEDLICSLKSKLKTPVEDVKKFSLKADKDNKSCKKAKKIDDSTIKLPSTKSEVVQHTLILVDETKVVSNAIPTHKTETKKNSSMAIISSKQGKETNNVVVQRSRLNTAQQVNTSTAITHSSKIVKISKPAIPKATTNITKPCSSSTLNSLKQTHKVETVKNRDTFSQKSSSSTDKSIVSNRSSMKSCSKNVDISEKSSEKDSKLKKPLPTKTPRSTIASNLRKTETQKVS